MGFPVFLFGGVLVQIIVSLHGSPLEVNQFPHNVSIDTTLSAAALNVKVSFQPYDDTWATFKSTFGRKYSSSVEEFFRYQTFLTNVKRIELHNTKFHNGQTTYWMGINQFTDMSVEEYRAYNRLHSSRNRTMSKTAMRCSPFLPPLNYVVSDTVDWRTKGYVTPVKNQGQCGSCWAFSTTGSLEGQHFRKTRRLVSLSEQQLVDCAGPFGPQGCDGGNEPPADAYIHSVGGIESEANYPYEARDDTCRFSSSKVAATVSGCERTRSGDERQLQQAVSSVGPVSVNIDASHNSFQHYSGGVYTEPECSTYALDHAVLAVGYGSLGGNDYWIVKNSWGLGWGKQGYILMARNRGNMCGIATEANFPLV